VNLVPLQFGVFQRRGQADCPAAIIDFFGDLPVLGGLFRNTTYNENDTELVIFLTPTIYSTDSKENEEMLERQKKIVGDLEREIDRAESLEIVE